MIKFWIVFVVTLYSTTVSLAQQEGKRLTFELLDTTFSSPRTIEEVSQLGSYFMPLQNEFLNLGFKEEASWIRIKVPPTPEEKPLFIEVEYPLLDSITLFFLEQTPLNSSPKWLSKTSGDAVSFYQRDVIYHNIIFRVNPTFVKENMFYFRIKTNGSLQVSLRLWNEETLQEEMQNEQFIFGALFGVFGVLAVYGILIGSMFSTRIYLYYGLLVFSVILFIAVFNGYAFQYVWANAPEWANESLPFSIGILTVSAINFTQLFLELKKHAPVLYRFTQLSSFIAGLVASIVFLGYYNFFTQVVVINGVIAALLIFYASVITRARNYKFARFMVSGSYLFLIGTLLTVLKSFAVVDTTFITKHGMELGAVFYLLLTAVALNEKYSTWKVNQLEEDE